MRKSTRLSTIGLDAAAVVREPPPVRVKSIQHRFSLTSFAKQVQQLTDDQRSVISKAGFGNLLLVPSRSLSKVLLTELMETWSFKKQAFELDSGEIRMTLLDAALILGLRVVGKPVLLREEEPFSELEELYGAGKTKRNVELRSLEDRLDSIGGIASDEFLRTFLLYTIGTFLSSNEKVVDSRYLSFLRDLDEVCEFAWGAAVVEDMAQWLDKRKEDNVQYVGGCLIFLQTWMYEHFGIARPQLQGHDLTFPRACRWGNSKSHRQQITSRFKDINDDQVIWTLQPTSAELQIEIVKEALEVLSDDSKDLQSEENCSPSTSSSVHGADSESQLSVSSEGNREDEVNFENQVVEDTPPKLSPCKYGEDREQEILIVEDTPPNLITCNGEYREPEVDLENLIVEDTPPKPSICDEIHGHQEMNLEDLIVEDTPTSSSTADKVSRVQEFDAEELIVEDTPSPPKLNICDDDLKKKYQDDLKMKNAMLEEENAELKMKLCKVMEENELLRRQVLSNKQFEEQNAELKKELDILREENRLYNLAISGFGDQLERHILGFETNAFET